MNIAMNHGVYGIINLTIHVLLTAAIIIAILIALIVLSHRSLETRASLDQYRDEIRQCREKRYEIISQALSMFGNENPEKDKLSRLYESYGKVDDESKEIEWEQHYIPTMQAFMKIAIKNAKPNMKKALELLNAELLSNEASLDDARNAYEKLSSRYRFYSSKPMTIILVPFQEAIRKKIAKARSASRG